MIYKGNQKTDSEYLERWAHAYILIKSIPDDRRFFIHSWGMKDKASECHTAACVGGHCALHPWFKDRGLIADFGSMQMDVAPEPFFGITRFALSPFDPFLYQNDGRYRPKLGKEPSDAGRFRVSPSLAAEAILDWMQHYWTDEEVHEAVKAANKPENQYDIDALHRLVPWSE